MKLTRNRNRLAEIFDRHLARLRRQAEKSGVPLVNLLLPSLEPHWRDDDLDPASDFERVIAAYRKEFFARHAEAGVSEALENRANRQAGGRKTGEARAREGEETKRRVLAVAKELESDGKGGRGLAGRIVRRLAKDLYKAPTERQIQNILRNARKESETS